MHLTPSTTLMIKLQKKRLSKTWKLSKSDVFLLFKITYSIPIIAREVCCLPGSKVRDVTKRVPQLVKSTDYCLLLPFHLGTNDNASRNLGRIKEDFKALGVKANNFGAQVIFSSILQLEERDQLETDAL